MLLVMEVSRKYGNVVGLTLIEDSLFSSSHRRWTVLFITSPVPVISGGLALSSVMSQSVSSLA